MTTQAFITSWGNSEEPLNPISPERLKPYQLSPATVEFLSGAGLPESAAPFLSFVADVDDEFMGISTLDALYDIEDGNRFIVIGSDGSGNPIAIDTKDNDTIVLLDHEDDFELLLDMNASVNQLAACLLHYRDFIETITKANGPDAFMTSKFSDAQFQVLKAQLIAADATAASGFWAVELDDLLQNRQ